MASSFREAAARGRQQQDYVYKDRQPQYNADGSFNRSPDSEIEKAKARYANPDYYYQGPGWDVGREDRIQQQKDALRKAAMQRRYNDIRAAQAAAVQGGAPVGGGNPYVADVGYSGVGDPEAQMQADYMAKRGGQAYVEPGRGGYNMADAGAGNEYNSFDKSHYNFHDTANGYSYDPNGQARPGAQPIGFRYVDNNGQATDYPLAYYDNQGIQIPDSTVNMAMAANPTYWAGRAGQYAAEQTSDEDIANAAENSNPFGFVNKINRAVYDFIAKPKEERYPGLHKKN